MNLPVIPGPGKREAENRFRRCRRQRGSNLIEFSLIVPWYIFLFVGALDSGFFAYSLIASQTAAREGALYCSTSAATCSSDSAMSTQCLYALDQLRMLPNVGSSLGSCGTGTTVTSTLPVAVSTASLTNATTPASPDGNPCTSVTVVYMTPQLIPIPGLFPGQVTITRTVKMRYTS
jgi:Flp pilus assembly protein TadG